MVERDVVHYSHAGLEKPNRAIALIHFTDKDLALADPCAGERGSRHHEVLHISAVHDRRALSSAVQNPADHADRSGLAAGAGDTNAQGGTVEEIGEQSRAGSDAGANTARSLDVGDRLLDSRGGDQDLTAPVNATTILR